MKVRWLGHSSFLITSNEGVRIITDPYRTSWDLKYDEIKEPADIITVSHEHLDHNNVTTVGGKPQVAKGITRVEIKGVKFIGVSTYHDESKGKDRGSNTVFCFEVDGVRVCHLGDLGHKLSNQEVAQVGKVDVLLIPVGGVYTINTDVATEVSNKLKPSIIIPMHYKNERCSFPISGVDDFLEGKRNIVKMDASEVEFEAEKFPAETQIIVLKPAL